MVVILKYKMTLCYRYAAIRCDEPFVFDVLDSKLILSELAMLERHQRHQGQLLQHILEALQRTDDGCQLPDGMELPVNSIKDLTELDSKLADDETAAQLVNSRYTFQ